MNKEANKPVFLVITESIRKDILFGNMEPGTPLIEKEIAERFSTSRAPVRESFRILEGEGLIVRNNPVGYKVRELNLDEFIERNTLLKIIEREMLLRAIPRYTELDLCQMDQLVEKISQCKNLEEFITHLIRFTEIIHKPTGWDFSIQLVIQILFRNVPVYREIAKKYMGQKMQLTTHKQFVGFCRKGKIQEAIDCWVVRYDNSENTVFSAHRKETAAEWQI
jgi:DNA-binding GntR family transcriptional regulator